MNKQELISVIIPVYNVNNYLRKCLQSIINQSYKNLEIIIIDDGSSDGSSEICDEFLSKDKRIKVIHKKNEGVSIARNIGISIAKGKYIGFVDSDDYIERNMYEILYNNLIRYNSDISMCNYYIEKDGKKTYKKHIDIKNILVIDDKIQFYKYLNENYYKGFLWNKLFKKELFNNNELDSQIHMCEDLLILARIAEKSKRYCFTTTCLYNYVLRKNSAYNSNINYKHLTALKAYEEIITIIKKYNDEMLIDSYKLTYFYWCNDICKKYNQWNINEKENILKKKKVLYKNLMKSNNLNWKNKIEIFIRNRLYIIYKIATKIKNILKRFIG